MPYGTPTPNEEIARHQADFQHTSTGISLTLIRQPSTWGTTTDHDEAFQTALDALSASPDLTFLGAAKTYDTTEDITPTP